MSIRSQLTKDLNESVKSLLGKQIKILLKNVVKLETKGDKTENRVLVFSPCRLFLLTAKVPTRIDSHFHYLEINSIESKRPNKLILYVGEKIFSFLTTTEGTQGNGNNNSQEVDSMIFAIATAVRNIFPTVPLGSIFRKIEVLPTKRIEQIKNWEVRSAESHTLGACGGFSTQYACMCDYHGVPYRDEVAWDVDTIYLCQDTRELSLKDFEHLDPKDMVPIISALEYNTWFKKVRASNIKLTHESIDRLLQVMKKSISIEELFLDNISVRADFAHKLSVSLSANESTLIHTLDLSNNVIEDKGAVHLCGLCSTLPKGLVYLNLSRCGLTSKGVNHLAQALSSNKAVSSTLTYLNLSDNNLKEEINNLCNFLAQPNVLKQLDISNTDFMIESLFGALLRGCATNLTHLNVSRNCFNLKKNKEIPPSFKQFFTSTLSLKSLSMSSCKLPLEALKNLLLGLACNESTVEMSLDISSNNLGTQGAHVLESCIHGVRCISSLDISDNNMDVELALVVAAVGKNKSIKHLYMGRNLLNMKAKHISTVMDSVVQLVQEEDCVLQSLMLPDSRLKSDLYNLINALGSNQCLQTIDISGNSMGDGGARLLAKALQINTRIRTIYYDRNNITLQGYCDLAYALESNYTVRFMPFPIHDIVPCMKASAEKTDAIMSRIQQLLQRNVTPKKYSNGQAFRLQQGFLLSSTQQMVDRLVVQTQDTIKTLAAETVCHNNEINIATALIQDADNSKQLLPRLHDVILRREEGGNPVEQKLRSISQDLHGFIVSYLQGTLENMLKCLDDECLHVLRYEHVADDIRKVCREKINVSQEFVESCIMDQAGTDIVNRVNELNLAVASHVSDRITDEVIEQLSKNYKTLIGDTVRKRSSTPDVLRSGSKISSREDRSESCFLVDTVCQLSDQSPLATPHLSTKKKSLYGRKLRPKSVVDTVEGLSADHIPDLLPTLPKSAEESLDSVAELPTQQLQHLVKGRPRRAKTRQPSRPMLKSSEIIENVEDLDTGLDVFFRPGSVTPTTPLVSPILDDRDGTPSTYKANRTPKSNSNDNLKKNSGTENSPELHPRGIKSLSSGEKQQTDDETNNEDIAGSGDHSGLITSNLLVLSQLGLIVIGQIDLQKGVVERASAELSKRINGLGLRSKHHRSEHGTKASVMERVTNVFCGSNNSSVSPGVHPPEKPSRLLSRHKVSGSTVNGGTIVVTPNLTRRNPHQQISVPSYVIWEQLILDERFLAKLFAYFTPYERRTLAQVCTKWRDHLYRSPRYWSGLLPVIRCKELRSGGQSDRARLYTSLLRRGFHAVSLLGATDEDALDLVHSFPLAAKHVHSISLRCSSVSDRGLEALLDHLQALFELELAGCNEVTEAGLWACLTPRIVALTLTDCINIADEAMGAVAQLLPALYEFSLQAYHVSDAALGYFSPKQSNSLSILRLQSCWEVTNHGVDNIVHSLPNLTVLSLSGCSKITDKGVESIAENLHNLKSLDLSWCPRITDAALEYIACDLNQLEELTLDRCLHVTDIGVGYISTMLSLSALFLRWCTLVKDFGLQHLCGMRNLQVLSLAGCPLLTSSGLSSLIQLRHLQELELTNCPGASPELFDYLKEHLPRCLIIE